MFFQFVFIRVQVFPGCLDCVHSKATILYLPDVDLSLSSTTLPWRGILVLHFIFFMFVPDVASSTMFLYPLKSKPSLIVVVRAVCLDFYSGSSQATYGAGGPCNLSWGLGRLIYFFKQSRNKRTHPVSFCWMFPQNLNHTRNIYFILWGVANVVLNHSIPQCGPLCGAGCGVRKLEDQEVPTTSKHLINGMIATSKQNVLQTLVFLIILQKDSLRKKREPPRCQKI